MCRFDLTNDITLLIGSNERKIVRINKITFHIKVIGDSSHNYRYPQVKSQNHSRILHKTQKNTIIVCAKLIHTNYGNPSWP